MHGLRSMSSARILLAVLGLALSLPAEGKRDNWRVLKTGQMTIYSVRSDADTRRIANDIRLFEASVGKFLQGASRIPDVPTLVYVVSSSDYARYAAPRAGTAGVFHRRPFHNLIVLDGSRDFDKVSDIVFHEYVHYLQDNTLDVERPPWYSEGFADLLSTFRERRGKLLIGEPPKGRFVDLAAWIPMQRMIQVDHRDREYTTHRLAAQFYAQSWLTMHYMNIGNPERARQLSRYLTLLTYSWTAEKAFEEAFGATTEAIDREVRAYAQKSTLNYYMFDPPERPVPETLLPAKLSVPAADAELARLMIDLNRSHSEAEALLAAAWREEPANTRAATRLAWILARNGKPGAARQVHSRIVNLDLVDPEAVTEAALFELKPPEPIATSDHDEGDDTDEGKAPLADTEILQGTQDSARRARDLLSPLVQAGNARLDTVYYWALASLKAEDPLPAIIEALERELPRAPWNPQYLWLLASLHERNGNKIQARHYLGTIILHSPDAESRRVAQRRLDSEELNSP